VQEDTSNYRKQDQP